MVDLQNPKQRTPLWGYFPWDLKDKIRKSKSNHEKFFLFFFSARSCSAFCKSSAHTWTSKSLLFVPRSSFGKMEASAARHMLIDTRTLKTWRKTRRHKALYKKVNTQEIEILNNSQLVTVSPFHQIAKEI